MNIRLIEGEGIPLDPAQDDRDRVARRAALAALAEIPAPDPLDTVGYKSAGHTLVIGTRADALPWAERLAAALPVTVLLLDDDGGDRTLRLYPVFAARALVVTGWLGAFDATWQSPGTAPEHARFDLVLDLGAAPQIATHQRPHGYYAPGLDPAARQAAVDALVEMVGEFEKPKYFAYKERLCAHGRNRRSGCNACVEICSAGAIAGAGDLIAVNPYLCAGCGACTTVCPTGALGYAYPSAAHTGMRIKAALHAYAQAGGRDPVLLVHGADGAALLEAVAQLPGSLPGRVLPLSVHHTASTGIDIWLAALAWGAAGVTVLMTDAEAPQYAAALDEQMTIAQTIMTGLGYAGAHVQLLRATGPDDLAPALQHAPRGELPARRAGFNVAADKRNTLDYALEHLLREAPQQVDEIVLPAGSPFGALDVDAGKCSLCMACVGACPASALQDGQNAPQLRFIEKNCVQCGLCADTCPEDAIRLVPRLSFRDTRKQPVVLTETQPFHCIRCNKPFGTLRMVESMLARLAGHPAFAGHLDRMRMCGDCRVIDMMTPTDEQTIHQAQELRRRP